MATYRIFGQVVDTDAPEARALFAEAHAAQHRPLCLCVEGGAPMYVARLGDDYIVKRMPNAGCRHAPECPSYEPPAELTGAETLLGTAIAEDATTGETTLKLAFPLSQSPGRHAVAAATGSSTTVKADGPALTMRGLLHYLWDQAGLTRWMSGFAGKRTWSVVRRHLLEAAVRKTAKGLPLRSRLYVPEPFSIERREEITARRLACWSDAMPRACGQRPLLMVLGELKELAPARHGYRAVVKHIPDRSFLVDGTLYRRLTRRFSRELALWSSSADVRLVLFGTFGLTPAGTPALVETTLMATNLHWLPIDDNFERQLIDRLVAEGRSFIKTLRYNAPDASLLMCALLLDAGAEAMPVSIAKDEDASMDTSGGWVWRAQQGTMPSLPARM